MKKTKLLSLLLIAVLSVGILASCSDISATKLHKMINKDYEKSTEAATAQNVSADGTEYARNDAFVAFYDSTDNGSYSLISTVSGKQVADLSNTATVKYNIVTVGEDAAIVTETKEGSDGKTETTYKLYDSQGEIASISSPDYKAIGALVIFGDAMYIADAKTGALSKFGDYAPYAAIPNVYAYNDEFIFETYSDDINVYSRETLELLSNYTKPSYASNYDFFILNNGNILIQYMVEYERYGDEDDYDVLLNGYQKMDLLTLIMNPENGKIKDIDCDYIVTELEARSLKYPGDDYDYFGILDEDIENIALLKPIEDKRINSDEKALFMAEITNKGKIKDAMKLDNGELCGNVEKLDDTHYLAYTTIGNIYVVNEDSEIIKRLNENTLSVGKYFFVEDEGLYDLDLNLIAKFESTSASTVNALPLDSAVILVETSVSSTDSTVKLTMYTNDGSKVIYDGKGSSVSDVDSIESVDVFYIETVSDDGALTTKYYNENGEVIATTAGHSLVYSNEDEAFCIVSEVKSNGDVIYYSIVK